VTDHHDGPRVSRRTLVRGVAALGFGGVLAACSRESGGTPVGDLGALFASANLCTLTESATQGPYYFDADRVRADIREDRPGTRLRLAFKVPNRLSEDDTKLNVELRFESMDDFQPAKVAEQITPLRKLLELRGSLANLRSSLIGNEKLDNLLQEMLKNQEMLQQAGSEAGVRVTEEKEK